MAATSLAAALSVGSVARAQDQPSDESVSVFVTVEDDGAIGVVESQNLRLDPTATHTSRVIPLDRTTGVTDVSVSEVQVETGAEIAYAEAPDQPNSFAVSQAADGLHIDWWFEPGVRDIRSFILRYTAHGVMRVYSDLATLDWKAVPADHTDPALDASVTVLLPPTGRTDGVVSSAYTFNSYGDVVREQAPGILGKSRVLDFRAEGLSDGTGYGVSVQMPRPMLAQAQSPAWQAGADRGDWIARLIGPARIAVIAVLALVGIVVVSRARNTRVATR